MTSRTETPAPSPLARPRRLRRACSDRRDRDRHRAHGRSVGAVIAAACGVGGAGLLLGGLLAAGCGDDAELPGYAGGSVGATGGAGGSTGGSATGAGGLGGSGGWAGPVLGLFEVSGEDATFGAYTGLAEIREPGDGGPLAVIHTVEWSTAEFEGLRPASAWQGTVTSSSESGPLALEVTLARVGFVTRYADEVRDLAPGANAPLLFSATLERDGPSILEGDIETMEGPVELGSHERWSYLGPSGDEPIWRNERTTFAGHDPLSSTERDSLFATFATFHQRAEVAPYVNRQEFQEAMHFWVFDPTDFALYRSDPGIVRVIQKVVDPISLAEASLRQRAYAPTLLDKQIALDELFPPQHLDEAGMFCSFDAGAPPAAQKLPSGDGILWTAVYSASQAMRYLVTGDSEALDSMVRSLDGELLCYEIAPTAGDFARTVRPHQTPLTGDWVQGLGPYAGFDWLPGANNDMIQGYFVGLTWAALALEQAGGHEQQLARMRTVLEGLLDSSPLLDVGGAFEQNKVLNRAKALLLSYLLTGDLTDYLEYAGYYTVVSQWLVDMGNGSTYEYGISDWSGNHLNLQSLLTMLVIANHAAGPLNQLADHAQAYRTGMAEGLARMRNTRIGLLQLVYGALGNFGTPPPDLEDALWVLREMPMPKTHSLEIDWRINPSFCISPFPNLPWKGDWADPSQDRSQSLTAYPLFERKPDVFQWKSMPGVYRDSVYSVEEPGADYLFAYWFARWTGVIDATD